jgi:hypothetical protein
MATLYGDGFANAYNAKPSLKDAVGNQGGRVQRLYFEYTITAAPTANDIIKVAKIPKGARVYGAGLKFGDLGTTGVLELGFAADVDAVETADADAFLASVDVNAAADFVTMDQQQEAGGALAGHLKKFSAECDLQILVTTAWTVTSGTIKGYLDYVVA